MTDRARNKPLGANGAFDYLGGERRGEADDGPFDPTRPGRLHRALPQEVWIELTSRCNVRCVYCAVSQPDYVGRDLELKGDAIADMLEPFSPPEVRITGHGETTMLDDWVETARTLMARGFAVTTNTNLAKKFTDEEIDTLSRFRSLEVSCDVADADLLARLRRGVRLDRVEGALQRIVAACERDFRDPPHISISCTLTDQCIDGLPDLVRWSERHRARSIEVVNLERYPTPPKGIEIAHPSEVDPARTLQRIAESRRLAEELGIRFRVQQGLIDACEGALA